MSGESRESAGAVEDAPATDDRLAADALAFAKLWPGGNPTLLVDLRGAGSCADLPATAAMLMREPYLGGEQVGFLLPPSRPGSAGRLEMMGGELCINATRAAARMLAGGSGKFSFETSGLPHPVEARVDGDAVALRFACPIVVTRLGEAGTRCDFVELPGIAHFVVDGPLGAAGQQRLEMLLRETHAADAHDAVGLIGVWRDGAGLAIDPLVHVRSTDSWIRETACGSGSLAALASALGSGEAAIRQPSGEVVEVAWRGGRVAFDGPVKLVARGDVIPLSPAPSAAAAHGPAAHGFPPPVVSLS